VLPPRSFAALRISPAGSDARKTAQACGVSAIPRRRTYGRTYNRVPGTDSSERPDVVEGSELPLWRTRFLPQVILTCTDGICLRPAWTRIRHFR
jgi:hypothetical protein